MMKFNKPNIRNTKRLVDKDQRKRTINLKRGQTRVFRNKNRLYIFCYLNIFNIKTIHTYQPLTPWRRKHLEVAPTAYRKLLVFKKI